MSTTHGGLHQPEALLHRAEVHHWLSHKVAAWLRRFDADGDGEVSWADFEVRGRTITHDRMTRRMTSSTFRGVSWGLTTFLRGDARAARAAAAAAVAGGRVPVTSGKDVAS